MDETDVLAAGRAGPTDIQLLHPGVHRTSVAAETHQRLVGETGDLMK